MLAGTYWAPLRYLTGHGHNEAAALYASAAITAQLRRPVRVRWDGEDWVHTWNGGALVTFRPSPEAPTEGVIDLPLFFHDYTPQQGDVIIDVGAGIGTELKVLSDLVGPTGRVISIEADPTAFRRLRKLNDHFGLTNTTLLQVAVGSEPGTAYLTQDDLDAVGNYLVDGRSEGAVPVTVTTLDNLVDEYGLDRIDYVKMNIEGAERDALKGFSAHGSEVRHWAISCHDFKETDWARTHAFVTGWLADLGREVRQHPEVPGVAHAGLYVYS